MLYHLFYALHGTFTGLNVFRYQTFRAMLAFLISFLFVLIFQPKFIRWVQAQGLKGQPIREDGPKSHEVKQGTPTMGGLVMIAAVLFAALLLADLTNFYVWLCLIVMSAHAWLGYVDDWRKIKQQNSKGISGAQKLMFQALVSCLAAGLLMMYGHGNELRLPFLKDHIFNLGILYVPFVMFVVVGSSNAVNLTDGLDGLAIGPVMTVAGTYAVFAYLSGNIKIANYLTIPYVTGAGEVAIILAALMAAGLGFLWYNSFPAQVFMGDVGALALGSVLGIVSVIVKQEVLLAIAGGVFVVEALSVIIQRYYYKLTKKRVFRMAPIHHHFELLGWAEPKIIVRFWIISIVLALVALTSLKLR